MLASEWHKVSYGSVDTIDMESSFSHWICTCFCFVVGITFIAIFVVYLTHWGWDKMDAISQKTLSNAFSWMTLLDFWLKFSLKFVTKGPINNISALWGGGWLSVNFQSYQYRNSYCGDKMILQSCYQNNENLCTGKTAFYIDIFPWLQ